MFTRTQRFELARLCGACLMASAGLAIAVPAAAQSSSSDAPISVHVSYADLNLGSREGAREMLGRIDDAADRACGGRPDPRVLDEIATYNSCKSQAVEHGVRSLDAPMVTAMAHLPGETRQFAQR